MTKNCYYCGQEITFDDQHVTARGKYVPLNAGANVPHDCPAKPAAKPFTQRTETEEDRRRWEI